MSQQIRRIRWQLFGHILRLPTNTPPQYLMDNYMHESATRRCKSGGQYWTLPRLLHTEIRKIGGQLRTADDLRELRQIAADREKWIALRIKIEQEWAEIEKVNEAKRKLVIILPPRRTPQQESEDNHIRVIPQRSNETEDQEESPSKRPRYDETLIIRFQAVTRTQKRAAEEVLQNATIEEEQETESSSSERPQKRHCK